MYELYPYFTNDGTVGLFSTQDDDIYHSTYGALTESWQKFIIPSDLERYLATHREVKILDVCYGIGYNSKTALQVFINNALEKEKIKKDLSKNYNKILKKYLNSNCIFPKVGIASIDTDNIQVGDLKNNSAEKNTDFEILNNIPHEYNDKIYADNISDGDFNGIQENDCENEPDEINMNNFSSTILIDAVDLDKTLMNLSPFVSRGIRNNLFLKKYKLQKYFSVDNEQDKLLQIQKIKKDEMKPLSKKFRLKKEVNIILLKKMLKSKPELFEDKILSSILSYKKYSPFLSKFMLNFAKFYRNQGYNSNKASNIATFLHNIYYQYVSKSYKSAKKILENNKIDLNFYAEDARSFIQSTNNTYNFVFLDAFTPAKCPVLWTVEFFKVLYDRLEDDGMILTYSNAAAIRNAFLQNGFVVGKSFDYQSKKFVGTIAVKNKSLIKHELDDRDWALINSKAGICFRDEKLNLGNASIIENREEEVNNSGLPTSTSVLKGYKNDNVKSL